MSNIFALTDSGNVDLIQDIRTKFLSEADTNPQFYHKIDVERCRSEDWQIERFIPENGSPDEAFKGLVKALKWKKSFGLHDRNHSYFPKELFKIFKLECCRDAQGGRLCIYAVLREYKRIGEFCEIIQQFCAFILEMLDRMVGNTGFIAIANAKGITLVNCDVPTALMGAQMMQYYPRVLLKSFLVDLPWPIVSLWKIVYNFLPKHLKEKTFVVKGEQLKDHIDVEINELSNCWKENPETNEESIDEKLPLNECKHLNFSDKQIDKFYNVYDFNHL